MEEKLELDMEARKNYLEMMARMNKNKKSVNERRTKVKTAGQRVKMGSIKDRKMNYEKDEYFFSKEDMPEKAREARKFYAQFMESDYLGLRKKPWEHSTFIDPMNRGEVNFDVEIFRVFYFFLAPWLNRIDQTCPQRKSPFEAKRAESRG